MSSDQRDEVNRARQLADRIGNISLALDEFDSDFEKRLDGTLRSSLLSELENLYEKIDSGIKSAETSAAIMSSVDEKEVWVVYDPAYSHGPRRFRAVWVSKGRTPEEANYLNASAVKASEFREIVQDLVDDLKNGRLSLNLRILADDLIGHRMSA